MWIQPVLPCSFAGIQGRAAAHPQVTTIALPSMAKHHAQVGILMAAGMQTRYQTTCKAICQLLSDSRIVLRSEASGVGMCWVRLGFSAARRYPKTHQHSPRNRFCAARRFIAVFNGFHSYSFLFPQALLRPPSRFHKLAGHKILVTSNSNTSDSMGSHRQWNIVWRNSPMLIHDDSKQICIRIMQA